MISICLEPFFLIITQFVAGRLDFGEEELPISKDQKVWPPAVSPPVVAYKISENCKDGSSPGDNEQLPCRLNFGCVVCFFGMVVKRSFYDQSSTPQKTPKKQGPVVPIIDTPFYGHRGGVELFDDRKITCRLLVVTLAVTKLRCLLFYAFNSSIAASICPRSFCCLPISISVSAIVDCV
jgi:hypothetical protein